MRTVFFDVDDTLVMWPSSKARKIKYTELKAVTVVDPYIKKENVKYELRVHQKHVDWLVRMKKRGEKIVVWSAGGEKWAKAVCDALKISKYVDVFLSKPDTMYDDADPKEWLPAKPRWEDPVS